MTAVTRRNSDSSFGNNVATRVRRAISLFNRSKPLTVRQRIRCSTGNSKIASPSGTLISIQAANFGAEQTLGLGSIRRGEHGAQRLRDFILQFQARHISLRVLLQVKLTALPRHRRKHGQASFLQARMIIGHDQLHARQPTRLQVLQKSAPVRFGFRQRHTDAEHAALTLGGDAHRQQYGAVKHASSLAHLAGRATRP